MVGPPLRATPPPSSGPLAVGAVGGTSLNAVQLGAEDGGHGVVGGLWRVPMPGSFDVPFRHLPFDAAGVGTEPSTGVGLLGQEFQGSSPAFVTAVRGKNRALVTASDG